MLRRRRVEATGSGGVGHGCAIAEPPDVPVALDLKRRPDPQAPALVDREAEVGDHRVRAAADGPDERVRRDGRPVGQASAAAGVDRDERRRCADLDASPFQLVSGVASKRLRHLRQDPRGRVNQDPPHRTAAQARMVPKGFAHEVLKLGQRLDARIAGADEEKGQVLLDPFRRGLLVGGVELSKRVVAQHDGVGQRLERERVLCQALDRQPAWNRAEGDDQVLVLQLHLSELGLHEGKPVACVQPMQPSDEQLGVRTECA